MENNKYRFTLFIPCYNSEKFIDRVFKSIDNFTFRNFEVIFVNDASTDKTNELIEEFIKRSKNPVKYLNRPNNKGLIANRNWGIENSEGEFILMMGHDDEWMPNTLAVYDQLLRKYDGDNIAGIGALCQTQYGELVGDKYPSDVYINGYWDTFYGKKIRKEAPLNYKTSVIKKYVKEYPQLMNIHKIIGIDYKMIFVNEIVRVYYVNENSDRLTNRSKKDMITRTGVVDFLLYVNKYQYAFKGRFMLKLRLLFEYPYYCILGNQTLNTMIKPIDKNIDKVKIIILYPFAKLLALKQK